MGRDREGIQAYVQNQAASHKARVMSASEASEEESDRKEEG